MNKKDLSERDICTKFITPALVAAGWDVQLHIREEIYFTKGRVIVRGKMTARGEAKRADYILYHPSGVPLALIEAKDNNHTVGAGMQQALGYAETLQVPFAFSSNGDAFLFHDRTLAEGEIEKEIPLTAFPSPADLWARYTDANGIPTARLPVVAQPFHDDGSGKAPRYYQTIAVNRAVEAVARGQNRLLLVMATGTGKTYVAFQTIWRLWKAGVKKRILFLADLVAQNHRYVMRITGDDTEGKAELDNFINPEVRQPPLTRRERAENVKKRNYFTKYGPQARAVLEALLKKYADSGLADLESPKVLQLDPFAAMGTPVQLVKAFGGSAAYAAAVRDLENQLYTA